MQRLSRSFIPLFTMKKFRCISDAAHFYAIKEKQIAFKEVQNVLNAVRPKSLKLTKIFEEEYFVAKQFLVEGEKILNDLKNGECDDIGECEENVLKCVERTIVAYFHDLNIDIRSWKAKRALCSFAIEHNQKKDNLTANHLIGGFLYAENVCMGYFYDPLQELELYYEYASFFVENFPLIDKDKIWNDLSPYILGNRDTTKDLEGIKFTKNIKSLYLYSAS
ncbi:hypothetical protein ACQ4LE_007171 [Meloidogyne hapla]